VGAKTAAHVLYGKINFRLVGFLYKKDNGIERDKKRIEDKPTYALYPFV